MSRRPFDTDSSAGISVGLGGLMNDKDDEMYRIWGTYTGQRYFGTPVRFELPPEWPRQWTRLTERDILAHIAPGSKRCSPQVRSERITALIEQRIAELPLPGGCVVIAAMPSHPMLWHDALASLAVLAKCTDTVWLRDKLPFLASAIKRGSVSLLVPPDFASALPAAEPDNQSDWITEGDDE